MLSATWTHSRRLSITLGLIAPLVISSLILKAISSDFFQVTALNASSQSIFFGYNPFWTCLLQTCWLLLRWRRFVLSRWRCFFLRQQKYPWGSSIQTPICWFQCNRYSIDNINYLEFLSLLVKRPDLMTLTPEVLKTLTESNYLAVFLNSVHCNHRSCSFYEPLS